MDTIICTGRIGRDAKSSTTKTGTPFCSFSLAVNKGYGEKKFTDWRKVTLFGKRAESLAPYLTKGTAVVVRGEPTIESYTNSDGEQKTMLSINADDIELLGGGNGEKTAAPAPAKPKPKPAVVSDEDIPF
jgi:single-strand DNA-binding protein